MDYHEIGPDNRRGTQPTGRHKRVRSCNQAGENIKTVSDLPKLHILVSIAGVGLLLLLLGGIGRSEQIPLPGLSVTRISSQERNRIR